ncbi:MAG: hypothetical protein CMB80_00860 [Flammeovirgaceae bacterium]|nr:hypothetical protein [Flammeovirgaceae bacterium]
MAKYATQVSKPKRHIQTKKARPDQVENYAGGYVFKVDEMTQLSRFILLGNDKGSYYADEKTLTVKNFENLKDALKKNGKEVVDLIVEISTKGRAPKNTPAVFALAVASVFGDKDVRSYANAQMPRVCRTSTDMFLWVDAVNQLKGGKWSTGIQRAIARWYTNRPAEKLAVQVCKYPHRKMASMEQGWGHRDVLRLVRLTPGNSKKGSSFVLPESHKNIVRYAVQGREERKIDWIKDEKVVDSRQLGFPDEQFDAFQNDPIMRYVWAHEEAKNSTNATEIANLIKDFGLTRESIDNSMFKPNVWKALLEDMPMTAMIRNLGQMTAADVLKPLSKEVGKVVSALNDEEQLQKSRIHPIGILIALKTYQLGHGLSKDKDGKFRVNWNPVPAVIDGLNDAFYKSFKYVEPTGKNFLLGVDVSSSMNGNSCVGSSILDAATAAGAMSLSIARVEKNSHIMAFADTLKDVDVTPKDRLDTVMNKFARISFGGTDCALPMLYATNNQLHVDAFVVLTDNETWAGQVHPYEALDEYRKRFNKDAKLVVMAFTATEFSIANAPRSPYGYSGSGEQYPQDPGALDVAGLDSAAPQIVSDFVAGKI